jgi:hypothetical protein
MHLNLRIRTFLKYLKYFSFSTNFVQWKLNFPQIIFWNNFLNLNSHHYIDTRNTHSQSWALKKSSSHHFHRHLEYHSYKSISTTHCWYFLKAKNGHVWYQCQKYLLYVHNNRKYPILVRTIWWWISNNWAVELNAAFTVNANERRWRKKLMCSNFLIQKLVCTTTIYNWKSIQQRFT